MKKNKNNINIDVQRYSPNYNDGLNSEQVKNRIDNGLDNKVNKKIGKSYGKIVFDNVFTFFNMLYVVIFFLLLSAKYTHPENKLAISNFSFVVIVLINLAIGTIQEIRAKKTVDTLKLLSASKAHVIRNGELVDIEISNVVLDDIIKFSSGNEIITDSIIQFGSVEVNESQLTGESVPIRKEVGETIYSGSFVVSGSCLAKVERVGEDNAIEQLALSAKKYRRPKSLILKTLRRMVKVITFFLIICGILMIFQSYNFSEFNKNLDTNAFNRFIYNDFYLGFVNKIGLFGHGNSNWYETITSTSGALLGMIPAGLLMMTSAALVLGVIRLSKHQTLVQDIYCVEMLARVDVLCLDKTGTITDGTMTVVNVEDLQKGKEKIDISSIISHMNAAFEDPNATQKALELYFGIDGSVKPKKVIPFSSDRKYSACQFGTNTYLIGAPEFILKSSYDKFADHLNEQANKGYRILCLAETSIDLTESSLTRAPHPLAFIYIEDQIRKEAVDTIASFINNGVEVKVISGDNPVTVANVAMRVGIKNADRYISLDGLTDDEVYLAATEYTVFGRVKPHQKQIIVKALKKAKKTVAMTGDGVNDILAMKEADCSIAMASGSDAVKSVAQLVLLDSNFASMPKVVAEGRRAINNVQKIGILYLVKTFFIIVLAILTIFGFFKATSGDATFPFIPSQLLMFEMFVIGIPSIFLTIQPNTDKISGNFLLGILYKCLPGSISIAIAIIITYSLSKSCGFDIDTTKSICVICMTLIGLMILYQACQPFNIKKIVLYASMCVICLTIIIQSTTKTPRIKIGSLDISESIANSFTLSNVYDNYIVQSNTENSLLFNNVKECLASYRDYINNNITIDSTFELDLETHEKVILKQTDSLLYSLNNAENYHLTAMIDFLDNYKTSVYFDEISISSKISINDVDSYISDLKDLKKDSKVNITPLLLTISLVASSFMVMSIVDYVIKILSRFIEKSHLLKLLKEKEEKSIEDYIDDENN